MSKRLFCKNELLAMMPRILAVLIILSPVSAFSQSQAPSEETNTASIELTNPKTGETGAVAISMVPIGNVEEASAEQLNSLNQDLRTSANAFGDDTLYVFQVEGEQGLPATYTQSLNVQPVEISKLTYSRFDPSLKYLTEKPKKLGFWKGVKRSATEKSLNDWVMVTVFFVGTRAGIGFHMACKEHTLAFAAMWATAVGLTTLSNNLFNNEIDQWANRGAENANRSLLNKDRLKIWSRYWRFDLGVDYLLNTISRRNSISQVFLDSFPRLANNFVSVQKANMFGSDRALKSAYSLIPLAIMTTIQQINNVVKQQAIWTWKSGHHEYLDYFNLSGATVWELRPTAIAAMGAYLILLGMNAKFPKTMIKGARLLHDYVATPISTAISRGIINLFNLKITPTDPCNKGLHLRKTPEIQIEQSISDDLGEFLFLPRRSLSIS